MATSTIITTPTTAAINPAVGDFIYVAQGGSIIRASGIAISNLTSTSNDVTMSIDGSVVAAGASSAVFLTGAIGGVGSNEVSIGLDGLVRSLVGRGLVLGGTACEVLNFGAIHAGDLAIDAGANTASLLIQNAGIISSGTSALKLLGDLTRVDNSGQIIGQAAGVDSQADRFNLVNSGSVRAQDSAIVSTGDRARIVNLGEMTSQTNDAIQFGGDFGQIDNSGTIAGGSNGIACERGPGFYTRIDIFNSGSITGRLVGIDQSMGSAAPAAARFLVQNSGTIQGGDSGISTSSLNLFLFNSGSIIGGSAFGVEASGFANVVVNTGLIAAGFGPSTFDVAVAFNTGTNILRNFGEVQGSVQGGNGGEVIRNGGILRGDVTMLDGRDSFDGRGGATEGAIFGGNGDDTIRGGAGDDLIFGDSNNDELRGGGGDDRLAGGTGVDTTTGGMGADVFFFSTAFDVTSGVAADHITDFTSKIDLIDLSFVVGGKFIGGAAFGNVAGEVRYQRNTGTLSGDQNGDGLADFILILDNRPVLTVADLLL